MGGFRLVSEVRLVWVNHRLLYLVLWANDGIPVVFRGGHRVTVHGWVAPEDWATWKAPCGQVYSTFGARCDRHEGHQGPCGGGL